MNYVPIGTTWDPDNGLHNGAKVIDPTTNTILATNYLRPVQGYGSVTIFSDFYNSNYNSLQTQANRRFSKRLQFGTAWTWSKGFSFYRTPGVADEAYKTPSGYRHNVVANWSCLVPDGSRLWKNAVTKMALDGWHLNGIGQFRTGSMGAIGLSFSNSAPLNCSVPNYGCPGAPTGTPSPSIPVFPNQNASIWLPSGYTVPANIDPKLYYPFNQGSFSLPALSTLGYGTAQTAMFAGPGVVNFDMTLFKDFRLKPEKLVLELRGEAYNVLNHMSPSNPTSGISYDLSTGKNTNANFGAITGSQSQARRMVVAVKLRF